MILFYKEPEKIFFEDLSYYYTVDSAITAQDAFCDIYCMRNTVNNEEKKFAYVNHNYYPIQDETFEKFLPFYLKITSENYDCQLKFFKKNGEVLGVTVQAVYGTAIYTNTNLIFNEFQRRNFKFLQTADEKYVVSLVPAFYPKIASRRISYFMIITKTEDFDKLIEGEIKSTTKYIYPQKFDFYHLETLNLTSAFLKNSEVNTSAQIYVKNPNYFYQLSNGVLTWKSTVYTPPTGFESSYDLKTGESWRLTYAKNNNYITEFERFPCFSGNSCYYMSYNNVNLYGSILSWLHVIYNEEIGRFILKDSAGTYYFQSEERENIIFSQNEIVHFSLIDEEMIFSGLTEAQNEILKEGLNLTFYQKTDISQISQTNLFYKNSYMDSAFFFKFHQDFLEKTGQKKLFLLDNQIFI